MKPDLYPKHFEENVSPGTLETALVQPPAGDQEARKRCYPSAPPAEHTSEVLGVRIAVADSQRILSYMGDVIANRQQAFILHVNVHALNLACRYSWLKRYLREVSMVFCDGDGVRLAARLLKRRPLTKVTYNVFLWELAEWCAMNDYGLYLLGGRPGISEKAADRLVERFPRLRILGHQNGYFQKQGDENKRVISQVNALRPHVVLVCFGMPVQERWVQENAHLLAAHVILTGGAALDYGAGVIRVAPRWMAKAQLEWLFRFLLEPFRLCKRYLIGNPVFLARVLLQAARHSPPQV